MRTTLGKPWDGGKGRSSTGSSITQENSCLVVRVHRFVSLPVHGVGHYSDSLRDLLKIYIDEGTYEKIDGFNRIGNWYVFS
jgi:hypothetical protein